jgi:Ca-activated chloride channel homolog
MIGGSFFGYQIALREPRLLIVAAVLVVAAVGLWLWRGWRSLPWTAVVVRALGFVALGIALAGPLIARPSPVGASVFVIDRSRSMGDDNASLIADQIADALSSRADHEPVGLVAFAERAAVVFPVGELTAATPRSVIATLLVNADIGSRDYTDAAGALRLAEALPTAGGRRLVLFSDGRETVGKARDWAAGAAGRSIVIDALAPDSRRRPNDLRVADLRAPASTWFGDDVEIEAVVAGDTVGDVRVQLRVDGGATGQQTVKLTAGTTGASGTARFTLKPLSEGYHALQVAIVSAGNDPIEENNALHAATVVRDRPSVLIVEGTRNNGFPLRRALERSQFEVTVREPGAVPTRAADLAAYDSIVLADVPATALSFERQLALQEYVRSLGRGLVVTGGNNSFGKGEYENSLLEETLPLRVVPRDEGKRPPVALLLIVDVSGSMDLPKPGPTKMEMAKTAAIGAVRALSPGDQVAVLAFAYSSTWVSRLRTINSQADIDAVTAQISRLQADGVTEMADALRIGIDELIGSTADTKHIILLSDGQPTTTFDPAVVAARARTNNLTLSTIAIGEQADTKLMEALAKGANGRYHFAARPEDIPRLTLEETEQLGGKQVATGNFRAVQTAPSPVMRGLEAGTLPTLSGYQITEAKPDAQVVLQSGRSEPILAQWQYGLGRVVAWTSDLSQEMAINWKDSEKYAPFWNQAVRWTLPAAVSPYFRVSTIQDGHDLILAVDAFDNGAAVNLTQTNGRLRTPSGAVVDLVLPQTAPGRYEVRLAAPQAGSYGLDLRQQRSGRGIADVNGFSVPYPAELRGPTVGDSILGSLADRTGGRVLPSADQVFDTTVLTNSPRFAPFWQPFAILALALFLIDIVLRLRHAATPRGMLRRLLPK